VTLKAPDPKGPGVLNDSMGLLKLLDKDLAEMGARFDDVARDEVRTWLWMFPDLFDKHEDCPCGSNKRVRYCCAQ
jgi:hypothetical protein